MTPEPTTHDLIVALRTKLGLFAGAMPCSPQQAWEEALALVKPVSTDETPEIYRWKGPGPAPASWDAPDGTKVYRSYADKVMD